MGACGFVSRNPLTPECASCGNGNSTGTPVVNKSATYDSKVDLSSCAIATAEFVNTRLVETGIKQVFANNYHCGVVGSVLYVHVPSSISTVDDAIIISMLDDSVHNIMLKEHTLRGFLESSLRRTLEPLWTRFVE